MKTLVNTLLKIIESARILGLNENDIENANHYLIHYEFELCLDTITTQMYEYDIEIDKDFYESISKIGEKMDLNKDSYSFMIELIRDKRNNISE